MTVAVERGDIDVNPCKQVKRNLERPRTEASDPVTFAAFIAWLTVQGAQRHVIALMAEFAAMVGSRRIELLHLTLPQIDSIAGEIAPSAPSSTAVPYVWKASASRLSWRNR